MLKSSLSFRKSVVLLEHIDGSIESGTKKSNNGLVVVVSVLRLTALLYVFGCIGPSTLLNTGSFVSVLNNNFRHV